MYGSSTSMVTTVLTARVLSPIVHLVIRHPLYKLFYFNFNIHVGISQLQLALVNHAVAYPSVQSVVVLLPPGITIVTLNSAEASHGETVKIWPMPTITLLKQHVSYDVKVPIITD